MNLYYENIPLVLTAPTLARLEPVLRKLAEDEWESERVASELLELANDMASRLQRIAVGDLQVSA